MIIVIKKGPKPIPGLAEKDVTEKPFDPESFDITKEQQFKVTKSRKNAF